MHIFLYLMNVNYFTGPSTSTAIGAADPDCGAGWSEALPETISEGTRINLC